MDKISSSNQLSMFSCHWKTNHCSVVRLKWTSMCWTISMSNDMSNTSSDNLNNTISCIYVVLLLKFVPYYGQNYLRYLPEPHMLPAFIQPISTMELALRYHPSAPIYVRCFKKILRYYIKWHIIENYIINRTSTWERNITGLSEAFRSHFWNIWFTSLNYIVLFVITLY